MKKKQKRCRKCHVYLRGGYRQNAQSWDYGFCASCFNQMPMNEIINYRESDLGVIDKDHIWVDYTTKIKWTPVDLYWHELTIRYLRDNNYEIP